MYERSETHPAQPLLVRGHHHSCPDEISRGGSAAAQLGDGNKAQKRQQAVPTTLNKNMSHISIAKLQPARAGFIKHAWSLK